MTAIAALPVMFTIGGAVDLNMFYTGRTKIQNAADAAALAAAKRFPFDPNEENLKKLAQNYFQANVGSLYRTTSTLHYEGTRLNENNVRELTISVEFAYDPVFLPLMGNFSGLDGKNRIESVVAIGNTTVEMAMVLDTSGSMNEVPSSGGGSKIVALRKIASNAITQLFDASQMAGVEDPARISVVPFAGAVNLGVKPDVWWLDPKGLHPNHHDHLFWDRYNYTEIPADYREPPLGGQGSDSWRDIRYQANQIAIRDPSSMLPLNQRPWVRRDDPSVYLTRQYLLANMGQTDAPVWNQLACPLSRPAWRFCIWSGANGTWVARNTVTNEACRQSGEKADATCHPPYTLKRTSQFFTQSNGSNPRVCAEARSGTYDLTDKTPDAREPQSLFLPYFAPDEYPVSGLNFLNNYLRDSDWTHPLGSTPLQNVGWELQQKDVRKYLMRPSRLQSDLGTNNARSPYYICESDPIVPLSSNPQAARQRVSSLTATGATNVEEGLAWGWRTLTSEEPFAGGRKSGDENNFKAIVVMTDGANTYYQNGNLTAGSQNRSNYGAYGFSRDRRIFQGTDLNADSASSYTAPEMTRAMDQRTATLCENVKNDGRVPVKTAQGYASLDGSGRQITRDGVLIYTIAFDIPRADKARVDKLLRDCASATIADQNAGRPLAQSQKYFYSATSNAELERAFNDIIASLTALRIAR